MNAAKKSAVVTPRQATSAATTGPAARLEQVSITHWDVTIALAKAEAALDLLRLAYANYEGEDFEPAYTICTDVIQQALASAKVAIAKAVGDRMAVAMRIAR